MDTCPVGINVIGPISFNKPQISKIQVGTNSERKVSPKDKEMVCSMGVPGGGGKVPKPNRVVAGLIPHGNRVITLCEISVSS